MAKGASLSMTQPTVSVIALNYSGASGQANPAESCRVGSRSLLLAEKMTQGHSPLHRRFGRGLFMVARKGQAS